MAEAEYGLVRRFLIDNGELDGLSPQNIFVLGYELALIDELIKTGEEFRRPVHSNNLERIKLELADKKREYRYSYFNDDPSEDWIDLQVLASLT